MAPDMPIVFKNVLRSMTYLLPKTGRYFDFSTMRVIISPGGRQINGDTALGLLHVGVNRGFRNQKSVISIRADFRARCGLFGQNGRGNVDYLQKQSRLMPFMRI